MSSYRLQQGIRTAQPAYQLGALFGAPYGLIGAGIGAALGLMSPDYEGRAIKAYNAEITKNAMQDLFDLRRMQNMRNIETAQALQAYQDQRTVGTASINAQYGAAEALGSSAQALQKTLAFQTQEAQQQVKRNFEVGVEDYNQQVQRTTSDAINRLQKSRSRQAPMDVASLVKGGLDFYKQSKLPSASKAQGTWFDNFKGVYNKPTPTIIG